MIILFFIGLFFLKNLFSFELFSDCEVKEKSHSQSNDNAYTISVIEKGCGATTASATHVIVEKLEPSFDQHTLFVIENVHDIEVDWVDERKVKLSIIGLSNDRVFKKDENWNDLKIEYEY